jgi:Recombinase
MRADGKSLQAIADELNAQRVPTLRGGAHWRPSSVQAATGYKRPGRVRRLENPPVPGRLPRNDW